MGMVSWHFPVDVLTLEIYAGFIKVIEVDGRVSCTSSEPAEGLASLPYPHGPFLLPAFQMSHKESEEALQKRLDEVSRELCRSQTSHASLRADAEKAQEQQQQLAGEGGGLTWSPQEGQEGLCQGQNP